MNQKNIKPATLGEARLFSTLVGHKVTGVFGNTDKGTGWRPVCRGIYLGVGVYETEKLAVSHGKSHLAELKARIKLLEKSMLQEKQDDVAVVQESKPMRPHETRKRKRQLYQGDTP